MFYVFAYIAEIMQVFTTIYIQQSNHYLSKSKPPYNLCLYSILLCVPVLTLKDCLLPEPSQTVGLRAILFEFLCYIISVDPVHPVCPKYICTILNF